MIVGNTVVVVRRAYEKASKMHEIIRNSPISYITSCDIGRRRGGTECMYSHIWIIGGPLMDR